MFQDETFTDEQIEEFQAVFDAFDKDGDGSVTLDELKMAMNQLGQTSEIEDVLKESDFQNFEEIKFKDFLNFLRKKLREPEIEEEMKAAFRIFDRSGSGFIISSDVKTVMSHMGERLTNQEADEMIRLADLKGNGYVTYDEFVQLMMTVKTL